MRWSQVQMTLLLILISGKTLTKRTTPAWKSCDSSQREARNIVTAIQNHLTCLVERVVARGETRKPKSSQWWWRNPETKTATTVATTVRATGLIVSNGKPGSLKNLLMSLFLKIIKILILKILIKVKISVKNSELISLYSLSLPEFQNIYIYRCHVCHP